MAAKKTTALTAGERLEKALVPAAEQPYEVPENWCWTKIGTVANLYRGVSYKKHEGHSKKGKDDCLVMRGGNIKEGEIDISAENIYISKELITDEQYIKKHDIIIVTSTGSTKVIGRAGISFADYDDVAFGAFLTLVRPVEAVHKPYVSYYFQGEMYRNRMRQLASGVNINNIRNEYITDTPIPLAPLAEQKRIVDTITELFADLDKAVENARKIIEKHKAKKESILYQAFSGKLTSQWRKEKGLGYDKWQDRTLEDVSYSIYDGDHMPPPKAENGVPFLMISNVNTGYLSFDNTKYVTQDYYDNLSETRKPRNGDVLYTLVGSYGIPVVVDTDTPFCFQRHMAVIKPRDIDTRFLWYQMQSQEIFNKATSIATGTAQLTVPIKGLRQMTIKVPTLPEQQEVVRILDELLADEQRIKKAAEETLAKIDLMKKFVLADAFRGKLGTNDPSDQPATELLKQILA